MVDGGGDGARLPLHRSLPSPESPVSVRTRVRTNCSTRGPPGTLQRERPSRVTSRVGSRPRSGKLYKHFVQVYRILMPLDIIPPGAVSGEVRDPIDGQEFQPFSPRHQRPPAGHRRRGPRAGRVAEDRRARGALRRERQPGARGLVALAGRGLRRRQSQPGRPGADCRRRFRSQHFRDLRGDRAHLRAPLLPAGDARDLDRLRAAAAAFAAVAAERPNDFEALEAANRDFHAITLEREFNLPAIEAMERNAGIINATRAKLPVTLSRLRQRIAQHAEIVEAIAAGDPEAAARAAIEHVRCAGEDLLQQMRQARTIGVRAASVVAPAARGAGQGAGRDSDLTRPGNRRSARAARGALPSLNFYISLW